MMNYRDLYLAVAVCLYASAPAAASVSTVVPGTMPTVAVLGHHDPNNPHVPGLNLVVSHELADELLLPCADGSAPLWHDDDKKDDASPASAHASALPRFAKAAARATKGNLRFFDKLITAAKGFMKCGLRDKDAVTADLEPKDWPHNWRLCHGGNEGKAKCTAAWADDPVCKAGENFDAIDGGCMSSTSAGVASLGKAERDIMGDVMGGWLAYDTYDLKNVHKGLKQCLGRFPGLGRDGKAVPGASVWTQLTQGYKNMNTWWPTGCT